MLKLFYLSWKLISGWSCVVKLELRPSDYDKDNLESHLVFARVILMAAWHVKPVNVRNSCFDSLSRLFNQFQVSDEVWDASFYTRICSTDAFSRETIYFPPSSHWFIVAGTVVYSKEIFYEKIFLPVLVAIDMWNSRFWLQSFKL